MDSSFYECNGSNDFVPLLLDLAVLIEEGDF